MTDAETIIDLRAQLARYQLLFPVEPTAPVTWNQMFDELVDAKAQLARCRAALKRFKEFIRAYFMDGVLRFGKRDGKLWTYRDEARELLSLEAPSDAAHGRDAPGPGERE